MKTMNLNDQLLDAVANSNLLLVKELLNSGANVNAHDGDFVTALQIASARGDDAMVGGFYFVFGKW
jgi:ankyrin repeat protein